MFARLRNKKSPKGTNGQRVIEQCRGHNEDLNGAQVGMISEVQKETSEMSKKTFKMEKPKNLKTSQKKMKPPRSTFRISPGRSHTPRASPSLPTSAKAFIHTSLILSSNVMICIHRKQGDKGEQDKRYRMGLRFAYPP